MTEGLPCLCGCQGKCTGGGACEPRVETESSHPPTGVIGQELEIVKLSTPLMESSQYCRPAGLALVTVCELYVRVGQGIIGNRKLLESDDRNILRSILPGTVFL